MNNLIILIIAIIIHELGHYLCFISFNIYPKISLKWWGIAMGESKDFKNLIPLQYYFLNISGILYGAVVLQYFNVSYEIWLIYIIMSGVDISNIIGILQIDKSMKKLTLKEIQNIQARNILKENGE